MPTPALVLRGWFAAMIAYVVLRTWATPLLNVSFPHWNDWSAANAGDVVLGLLIQVGVAGPVVFIAWRVLGWLGRLLPSPRQPSPRSPLR